MLSGGESASWGVAGMHCSSPVLSFRLQLCCLCCRRQREVGLKGSVLSCVSIIRPTVGTVNSSPGLTQSTVRFTSGLPSSTVSVSSFLYMVHTLTVDGGFHFLAVATQKFAPKRWHQTQEPPAEPTRYGHTQPEKSKKKGWPPASSCHYCFR